MCRSALAASDDAAARAGNLVPDSVPVDDDEDHNKIEDTWGEFEREDWMLSHYDLTYMAGIANSEKGSLVAGSRGYFLTDFGVLLNQALITYAMHFLRKRGYTPLQTPFVMNKSLMGRVAQLGDFDEQLYKARAPAAPTRGDRRPPRATRAAATAGPSAHLTRCGR